MASSSSTAVMAERRGSGAVTDDDDEDDLLPETGYKKMYVDDTYPSEFPRKNVEKQDFGRDTNRLDYFNVTPFDVHGDGNIPGTATYGGGCSGGGNDTRQLSVGIDDINGGGGDGGNSGGGDVVVQRSVQSAIGGDGGRSAGKRSIGGVGERAVKRGGHRRWWRRFWLKLTKKK